MQAIYRKKYKIEISDIDYNKRLKLSSLFNYFQDTASEAIDQLGIGIETIANKYGVIWVLIKMYVEIISYPLWNDEIIIETWPKKTNALDFERDFFVYDRKGNIIIKAISTWVLLDKNTRRIKRSNSIALPYVNVDKSALDYKLKKLNPYQDLVYVYSKMIGYSDIDFNGHLNNSKYLDYIIDCFSFQEHQKHMIKSIEVNFINEALPGDTLILRKDISRIDENLVYVQGENDNQLTFKAEIKLV